jgi:hypothetical protein
MSICGGNGLRLSKVSHYSIHIRSDDILYTTDDDLLLLLQV